MKLEPRKLLCINCLRGGACTGCIPESNVQDAWKTIENNPDIHITLIGAFDEVGARTELFEKQTPAQRRKDLDVMQRLGICYSDTKTARDLLYRIADSIPDLKGICEYPENEYGTWDECEISRKGYYTKGNKRLEYAQTEDVMKAVKCSSAQGVFDSDHIYIRAHHLLCIVCFVGSETDEPILEDNLYEAWMMFRDNPEIPVTVIEGAEDCCICPPCHSFVPERGICVYPCHLRDRKKDLDTMVALGVSPGDTLTARELYKRIYKKIPHCSIVCRYDQDTNFEWTSCSTVDSGQYELGLAKGILK